MTKQEWEEASDDKKFESLTDLFMRHGRSLEIAKDMAQLTGWPVDTPEYVRNYQKITPVEAKEILVLMDEKPVAANANKPTDNFLTAVYDRYFRSEINAVVRGAKKLLAKAEHG